VRGSLRASPNVARAWATAGLSIVRDALIVRAAIDQRSYDRRARRGSRRIPGVGYPVRALEFSASR